MVETKASHFMMPRVGCIQSDQSNIVLHMDEFTFPEKIFIKTIRPRKPCHNVKQRQIVISGNGKVRLASRFQKILGCPKLAFARALRNIT